MFLVDEHTTSWMGTTCVVPVRDFSLASDLSTYTVPTPLGDFSVWMTFYSDAEIWVSVYDQDGSRVEMGDFAAVEEAREFAAVEITKRAFKRPCPGCGRPADVDCHELCPL